MDKPTAAILLTVLVHFAGVGTLVWLAIDGRPDWRGWWPTDEDGRGGPGDPPPGSPGDGPPLASAEPARRRLRTEHERLARRPARRPHRAPGPAPEREPA